MIRYKIKSSTRVLPSIDFSTHLNEEQLQAVTTGDGPTLVIAGAGSGKTRVVTYRVAYLLTKGVDPSQIMLLTFTNRAAKEMLRRVELLIKRDITKIWGGTFHHTGNLMLRKYGNTIKIDPGFTILDREDSRDLIDSCIAELNLRADKMFPRGNVIMDVFSLASGSMKEIEDIIHDMLPHLSEYIEGIVKVNDLYAKKKREMNLMDFDDLLVFWYKLLIEDDHLKEVLTDKFQYILVDEYQDTNKLQAQIVDLMASKHRNIMVVGDDSQSIYSFRGACFDNIIRFPERYPDVRIFSLTTNYRSTREILKLANASISHNKRQFPKTLHSIERSGPMPALVPLKDVAQQSEFVAQRVLELIDEGVPPSEIAILYRSHYQSMDIQMELMRRGIPYEVRSGLRFFEQAHIKDVVSYLRVLVNPMDEISWYRVLKLIPGIGNASARKVWDYIHRNENLINAVLSEDIFKIIPSRARKGWEDFRQFMNGLVKEELYNDPSRAINYILENGYDEYLKSSYENYIDRHDDIEQLSVYASNYDSTGAFLSELALLTSIQSEDIIEPDEHKETIVLSTIHRAKGLEWSRVFIIGLIDGAFPPSRSIGDSEAEEEERRIFYVAITRAKDELYLCYPIMDNNWYNGSIIRRPSIFIQELPEETYEKWQVEY